MLTQRNAAFGYETSVESSPLTSKGDNNIMRKASVDGFAKQNQHAACGAVSISTFKITHVRPS